MVLQSTREKSKCIKDLAEFRWSALDDRSRAKRRKVFVYKTLGIAIISGLEVTVSIEVDVSILFGLEVNVEAVLSYLVEVFMENSFVFLTCVWYGVAFLRA